MFQWDAVDTSPDLGGQNVLKTFEMAIRHYRRTTWTELERVFCCWIFFTYIEVYFYGPLQGGEGAIAPIAAPMDPPLP